MTLNEYQAQAMTTCMQTSENFPYMMLNLVGEVGEFASKVAKAIRKGQVQIGGDTFDEKHNIWANELCDCADPSNRTVPAALEEELKKEAGDILWQLAGLCFDMGWTLEEVGRANLEKLAIRQIEGTIDGNGDGNTAAEGRK